MSDGGLDRASLGVEVWKSSQMLIAPRSAVRSIAWLDRLSWRLRDFQLLDAIPRQRESQIRFNVLMAQSHVRR